MGRGVTVGRRTGRDSDPGTGAGWGTVPDGAGPDPHAASQAHSKSRVHNFMARTVTK